MAKFKSIRYSLIIVAIILILGIVKTVSNVQDSAAKDQAISIVKQNYDTAQFLLEAEGPQKINNEDCYIIYLVNKTAETSTVIETFAVSSKEDQLYKLDKSSNTFLSFKK